MRGRARLQLRNENGALQDFEMALRVSPNDKKAHYMRGRILLDLNRKDEAFKSLRAASQLGSVEARKFLSKNNL